jgi:hypothetical protein
MSEWQDIATAPKDGRQIIVYFPELGPWQVRWSTEVFDNGFWCVTDRKFEDRPLRGWIKAPTHWQPLPAPPVEAER